MTAVREAGSDRDGLRDLCRLYGVETAYDDATGERVEASDESLLAVLPAVGAPVAGLGDVPDALRERSQRIWRRSIEPVTLAWDGGPAEVALRLPAKQASGAIGCTLRLEDGAERRWSCRPDDAPVGGGAEVEGVAYVAKRLALTDRLPLGYHRLTLDLPGGPAETLVIAAPTRAYSPTGRGWERSWGVFLPLYSLHSKRSWGAGDFTDLELLVDWTRGLGGGVVGTLPLLAAFLDEPYEPSPYSPVSRLFWNEFYIDVDRVPEVARGSAESSFREERETLRSASLVDYRRLMAIKRRTLEAATKSFFAEASGRRAEFERYAAANPSLDDYAAFRAVGERLRAAWTDWPDRLRGGDVRPGDYDEGAKRYHAYVQWLADGQLAAVSEKARAAGRGLYLDLPLGVNAAGYDTWRERSSFAVGVAGGAPPDPGFPKGQNWGFVPLHPEGVRESGYRYVRAFLRHQLRFAGVLRIDHMPSFHRVYWIPPGRDAKDGAYVRYPAEELYAVFALESHRHRTLLVGEDLGTVPVEVPPAMAKHNVHRMSVVQYELKPDPGAALPDPPAASLACVNTHDMPPFAAYWDGRDVAERRELDLIDAEGARREEESRRKLRDALTRFLALDAMPDVPPDARSALRALLTRLRDGPARVLLVNLEDLWSETEPQNVPSTTGEESPNWRRKARHSLEEFTAMPEVRAILREIGEGFA